MFKLPSDTPDSIRRLPVESRGYPLPWFVATLPDGTRDIRFADPDAKAKVIKNRCCWVCGETLFGNFGLLGGPLSFVNRRYSDFPMHVDCARFSAKYCPHLVQSRSVYRQDKELQKDITTARGHINEHPGVYVLPISTSCRFIENNELCSPVHTTHVEFWFEGKQIEREEAIDRWVPAKFLTEDDIAAVKNLMRKTI